MSVEIHVLVVDDSAFMRRAIQKMCEKEPDLKVIATATSGEEGVEKALQFKPDVITMDVEMPGMGGLEAARTLAGRGGPPIIMISSLTREGAETTLQALEIGAVDFIPKPDSAFIDILKVQRELVEKIRHFGTRSAYLRANRGRPATVIPAAPAAPAPVAPPRTPVLAPRPSVARTTKFECVALGTSTGGPVALSQIIPKLPKDFPIPVVIVQHMPPGFTRPLSERLNNASQIAVVEAQHGMILRGGTAYVAPAGQQLRLRRGASGVEIVLSADLEKSTLHVPSVDVMAASVGETFGAGALGVILTGMGHDGVDGLRVLKNAGGYVVGQDEASSVVYGMPRAAAVAGLVDRVASLSEVARTLCELTGTTAPIV